MSTTTKKFRIWNPEGMVIEFVDGEFKARNGLIGIDRGAWYDREIIGNIHESPELLKP